MRNTYEKNLLHPVRALNSMRKFIAAALDVNGYADEVDEDGYYTGNLVFPAIHFRKDYEFAAFVDVYVSDLQFAYCYDDLMAENQRAFRRECIRRNHHARNFADITLTLLHELGHFETRKLVPEDFNRNAELEAIDDDWPMDAQNRAYFNLLDETLATNWAMQWLNDADNRRLARQFEKKFFSCFCN